MKKATSHDNQIALFGEPLAAAQGKVIAEVAEMKPKKKRLSQKVDEGYSQQPLFGSPKTMTLQDLWRTCGDLRREQYRKQAAYAAEQKKAAAPVQIAAKEVAS